MIDSKDLVAAATETAEAARLALEWLELPKNADLVGNRIEVTRETLQKGLIASRRLAGAATRPMSVAVFGASQAGKSHLVSTLSSGGRDLFIRFNGVAQPVNFVERLNPHGGKESTGLVTRFSTRLADTPPGLPVRLTLFNHADVIKIIANAYVFDGKPRMAISVEQVIAHLAPFRSGSGGRAVRNGLSKEDVWDLREYFARYLGESALAQNLANARYWQAVADIAPTLSIERLGELLSVTWGQYPQLTALYRKLVKGLDQLDFAHEAFVPLTVADRHAGSSFTIMEVAALEHLDDAAGETCAVRTREGAVAELPKAVVGALAAEVDMCILEAPFPFFEHTDLLDFPGYRNRGQRPADATDDVVEVDLIGRRLATAPNEVIKDLMVRGKVEYLFQRYVADQDITAMLLCVKPSNQDVTDLPRVVSHWVGMSHGETSAERRNVTPLLFFVLTMFDATAFDRMTSDAASGYRTRFEARLQASLIQPYRVAGGWVDDWADGRPFNNLFLMRKPSTTEAEAVFRLEGAREIEVRPDRQQWVEQVRSGFLSVDAVQRHFSNPGRAFDEMLRANDGGATYVAEQLSPVCRPDVKPGRVRDAISVVCRRLDEALEPYYRTSDVAERLRQRLEVAARIIGDLNDSATSGRLGGVLRGFMVDGGTMVDYLYQSEVAEQGETSEPAAEIRAVPFGAQSRPTLPGGLRPPTLPGGMAPAAAASRDVTLRDAVRVGSTYQRLAAQAIKGWVGGMFERAGQEAFAQDVYVSTENLREIATELASAVSRVDLGRRIAEVIEKHAFSADSRERRREKAAIIATRLINRFVADLAMTDLPLAERPVVPDETGDGGRPIYAPRRVSYDAQDIPADPVPYATRAAEDWLFAFYRTVEANATYDGAHGVDLRENARLGEILAALRGNF